MKKIFTSMVVALMMVALPSQAQFSYGITAGLNMTKMSYSESEMKDNAKDNAGFFVGPTVKFTLPVVGIGFDAAAVYDQRSSENGDTKIKSSSIQIPINLRYGMGLGSMAEVFAFAGPQFGFNLGSKDKTLAVDEASNEIQNWTLKSSNLSANVGIGATVLGHLQAKFNYNIALGKTGEANVIDSTTGAVKSVVGDGKANAWQVSVTYFF